jgi:heme-degrading monooxygenase HmoA
VRPAPSAAPDEPAGVDRLCVNRVAAVSERAGTACQNRHMHLVLFEYRLRDSADRKAYAALSDHLYDVVASEPHYGFIATETVDRPDGSRLVVEQFRDADGVRAWRSHPEHRVAQQRGRDEFYEWYRVRTFDAVRDWSYAATR